MSRTETTVQNGLDIEALKNLRIEDDQVLNPIQLATFQFNSKQKRENVDDYISDNVLRGRDINSTSERFCFRCLELPPELFPLKMPPKGDDRKQQRDNNLSYYDNEDDDIERVQRLTQSHSHHTSLAALESSASNGCPLCILFSEALYSFKSPSSGGELDDGLLRLQGHFDVINGRIHDRRHGILYLTMGRCKGYLNFSNETDENKMPLSHSPRSDSVFALANGWIQDCKSSHNTCNFDIDAEFLPNRLIRMNPDSNRLRLVLTKDFKNTNVAYITLSYCWGHSIPESALTTTQNLAENLKSIRWSTLPRTYKDAIEIAQKLNVQYLWIDSLCILQDSPIDWQAESSLMGKIYSHSLCTIAAAAAANGDGTCFNERRGRGGVTLTFPSPSSSSSSAQSPPAATDISPRNITIYPRIPRWTDDYLSCPLNKRAWAVQERQLSRRVLHFTRHQLLWECFVLRASETQPLGCRPTSHSRIFEMQYEADYIAGLDTDPESQKEVRKQLAGLFPERWRTIVADYSGREMSKREDKLAAISGLAHDLQGKVAAGEYVAGLWRESFAQDLAWYCVDGSAERLVPYQAPSWSWASLHGKIQYVDSWTKYSNLRSRWPVVESVYKELVGQDPNGQLKSGKVRVRGTVRIAILLDNMLVYTAAKNESLDGSTEEKYNIERVKKEYGESSARALELIMKENKISRIRLDVNKTAKIHWDLESERKKSEARFVTCLYLVEEHNRLLDFQRDESAVLVLVHDEHGKERGSYRRIGLLRRVNFKWIIGGSKVALEIT